MCTVSWHVREDVFTVFFNRDEHQNRESARPPAIREINGVRALFPEDPTGGGTWLGVNSSGSILCILNAYEHLSLNSSRYSSTYTSRGLIVLKLLSSTCSDGAECHLRDQNLNHFRPFHVLFLSSGEQKKWTWDGKELSCRDLQNAPNLFTTSSLMPMEISSWRLHEFQKKVHSVDDARRYHYFTDPLKREWSARMKRRSVRTVSISEISVGFSGIQFTYDDFSSPSSCSVLSIASTLPGEEG